MIPSRDEALALLKKALHLLDAAEEHGAAATVAQAIELLEAPRVPLPATG